jgi:hypothetical protein
MQTSFANANADATISKRIGDDEQMAFAGPWPRSILSEAVARIVSAM